MIFGFEHGASRRYATLAERLIGSESADAPLPPGIILENDRVEYAFHKRETLWCAKFFWAALAANFNRVAIVPTSAPLLLVVTGVLTDQASLVSIATIAGFTNSGHVGVRDSRATTPASSIFTLQANALLTDAVKAIWIPANQFTRVEFIVGVKTPTPLGVLVESSVVNVAQNIAIVGYERPATPDELSQ